MRLSRMIGIGVLTVGLVSCGGATAPAGNSARACPPGHCDSMPGCRDAKCMVDGHHDDSRCPMTRG